MDTLNRHPSPWKRAVVLLLILAGLASVASSDLLHTVLLRLVDWTTEAIHGHPVLGMSAFMALAATSAILAFFSSAVLIPVAVAAWGKTVSVLLLWGGWTLGGMATYALGRTLGRRVVVRLVPSDALARFETRLSTRTPFTLVLLFQLAVPSEVPGYVLGLLRYSFSKYSIAFGIAELPYAVGMIYLGESVLERRTIQLLVLGLTGAVLAGWALRTLQRRLFD